MEPPWVQILPIDYILLYLLAGTKTHAFRRRGVGLVESTGGRGIWMDLHGIRELFISCASAACVGATRKIVYLTKQIKIFLVAPTQAAEAHERGHHLWLGILLWPGV